MRFGTLADLLAPQPWALDEDGAILGHLLMVEEAVYLSVIERDQLDGFTLDEAFGLPWVDLDKRAVWTQVYAEALRALADQAEGQLEAQRRREALQQLTRGEQ